MSQQQLRRNSYHHGNLKQALIEAATEMVLESGIGSVTMRALARRVGVSPAAYAYHFPDKGSLLLAIATEGFRKLNDYFEPALEHDDPRERLRVLGERYIDFALQYPGHYRVMFGDHAALEKTEPDEEFLTQSGGAFRALVDTMEAVMDGSDSQTSGLDAALMIWSHIHGAVLLWNTDMFPPPIAGAEPRSEADFRRLTFEAMRNAVETLVGG